MTELEQAKADNLKLIEALKLIRARAQNLEGKNLTLRCQLIVEDVNRVLSHTGNL